MRRFGRIPISHSRSHSESDCLRVFCSAGRRNNNSVVDTPGPAQPSGIVGSLHTLSDGLVASVQDRLELLSIELQEEKFRLIQALIWIGAAMFMGALALAFASLV